MQDIRVEVYRTKIDDKISDKLDEFIVTTKNDYDRNDIDITLFEEEFRQSVLHHVCQYLIPACDVEQGVKESDNLVLRGVCCTGINQFCSDSDFTMGFNFCRRHGVGEENFLLKCFIVRG